MFSLLIVVIYLSFISLGLPDSITGAAWPVMQQELGAPLSYAGIITMIIAFGTVISGLMSEMVIRRLGAGLATAVSVLMTAAALFGFSVSKSFLPLCLWSIPYGLGAGAVDAALNNYVALHYSARHMNWLHCFWGVGCSLGPCIMGYCLSAQMGWRSGYRTISIMQIVLAAIIFASLPMWKKSVSETAESEKPTGIAAALKIKGVPLALLLFFGYCSLESTAGIWASSYFASFKGADPETAAKLASVFYIGITAGRFLSGIIADKAGDRTLIRTGFSVILPGLILTAIPSEGIWLSAAGLILIGLGCAPIYPAMIHAVPTNFGKECSQSIIGIQMASAYVGTTFMPPLFGIIAENVSLGCYPFYMLIFLILMITASETLNKTVDKNIS